MVSGTISSFMLRVFKTVAFLPWYAGTSDPREASVGRGDDAAKCGVCGTLLEWRSPDEAACGSCGRRVPAGGPGEDHIFAWTITLRIER